MSQFDESLPSAGGKAKSFTPDTAPRTPHSQVAHNVALVLGGGGAAGQAWQIGVIAGLAEAGLDLTDAADLVVGTSSGATTAAWVRSGIPPAELFASVLSEPADRSHSTASDRRPRRRPPRCSRGCVPSAPPPRRQPIYNVRGRVRVGERPHFPQARRSSGAQWSPPGCHAINGLTGR